MEKELTKILIVEDEAPVRWLLKRSLEDVGYLCGVAANVAEAKAELAASPFDLVLSDIKMPGETGIDLLKWVRQSYPGIAVVMLTAVVDTQVAIEAMRMGAYHYLTKPFNLEEVYLVVERAIEKRNLILATQLNHLFLKKKVEQQTEQIRHTFLGAMKALAAALEAKDPYTQGHSQRTARIACDMARSMGLSVKRVEQLQLAAELHDIGKIGVSGSILHKNGKLTGQEMVSIQEHPVIGERILGPVVRSQEVLAIVRHHHEIYCGGGYPDGVAREEIPLGARLLTVADAYDAMTSSRPYRKALSHEIARRELIAHSGRQFDPDAVEAFVSSEDSILEVLVERAG